MKKLLTIPQTSERTELSEKAIRMKIWRGEFPCVRIGRRIFVPEQELEKFLSTLSGTTAEEAVAKVEEAAR